MVKPAVSAGKQAPMAHKGEGVIGEGFQLGLGFTAAAFLLGLLLGRNQDRAQAGFRQGRWMRLGRGGVKIRAAIRAGVMGQDLNKQPGGTVNVSIDWQAATLDFQDRPITWPMQVVAQLVDSGGNLVGVTRCAFNQNSSPICELVDATPGAHNTLISLAVPGDATPGAVLRVLVQLRASSSNAQGQPNNRTFVLSAIVATVTTTETITVVAPTRPAVPGGSISNITLSQRMRQRIGAYRGFQGRQ